MEQIFWSISMSDGRRNITEFFNWTTEQNTERDEQSSLSQTEFSQ